MSQYETNRGTIMFPNTFLCLSDILCVYITINLLSFSGQILEEALRRLQQFKMQQQQQQQQQQQRQPQQQQ